MKRSSESLLKSLFIMSWKTQHTWTGSYPA